MAGEKIAIVGVGSIGSYVLGFTTKTPVAENHNFDSRIFSTTPSARPANHPSIS
jgi:hypothetical protein